MLLSTIIHFYFVHTILKTFSYNIVYYILDTLIIGSFFIAGSIDSWGLSSWVDITGYSLWYVFIRGIIALITFIAIKVKRITKISNCNTPYIILMVVNIILNLITVLLVTGQWFGASGV
jgi:hypothetical protein